MATPGIGPRVQGCADAGGVEMEIADQLQEIGVAITEDRLVTSLKHMPSLVVAVVVVLAICELERLHGARQRDRAGLQQQMEVIGHQHIGIERTAVPAAIAGEPREIGCGIGIVVEDDATAVPTGNHMIEGAGEINPRFTSHRAGAYAAADSKSILMPDPISCSHFLLDDLAQYAEALRLVQRSASLTETVPASDASGRRDDTTLARILHIQGHYAEAEQMSRKAFSRLEATVGADHPNLAWSLGDLATIAYDYGHCDEAQGLAQRASTILEKRFGTKYIDGMWILDILAEVYLKQGRLVDVVQLAAWTQKVREEVFGLEDPDVALSLNILAAANVALGKLSDAETQARRALLINKKVYGSDHPAIASNLQTLAEVYRERGLIAEAEPLYKKALVIYQRTLKAETVDVAKCLESYSVLLQKANRSGEAEKMKAHASAIRTKVSGDINSDIKSRRY